MDQQQPKKPLKREQSAPLDQLRLVLRQHAVLLNPIDNQVSVLPLDEQLEYYFVPSQYMDQYQAYHRPGKPFKNLKLVNFDKPAIPLSFFVKYEYQIKRDVDPQQALTYLQQHGMSCSTAPSSSSSVLLSNTNSSRPMS